jgi:hypothetical protein
VRETIEELGGTMPENLPTESSIKKLDKQKDNDLLPEIEKLKKKKK